MGACAAIAVTALALTDLAACAVFESDPDPPPLFVDSGSNGSGVDAGRDATLGDATLDALSEAGRDAGRDASARPDAPPDARLDGILDAGESTDGGDDARVSDAGGHDASLPDAAIHDARTEAARVTDGASDAARRGYCAAAFATLAPLTFAACDDFDEDAGSYGSPSPNNPPLSTLAVQSVVSNSPPSSLLVTTQPIFDSAVVTSAVQFAVPIATSYVLQFDVKVDAFSVATPGSTVIGAINFQNGAYNEDVALGLYGGGDAGPLTIGVGEGEPADSGEDGYKAHPTFPFPATGTWTHVTLQLVSGASSGPWSYELSVDDVAVDSNELRSAFSPAGYGYATVGLGFSEGRGVRELYFDNILVEAH